MSPLAFLLLSVLAAGRSEETTSQPLEHLFSIIEDCKSQYPSVKDARVIGFVKQENAPKNGEEECLANCIMTRAGLIRDGKMNVQYFKELNSPTYLNLPDKSDYEKKLNDCAGVEHKETDACKITSSILKCLMEGKSVNGTNGTNQGESNNVQQQMELKNI